MRCEKHHFHRALLAIIIFALAFSLISTVMATLISGVPHHAQIKWYYCGPGCLDMMFDFYGPRVDQTEIADAARTDVAYAGTFTDDMIRAAHFSDLSTSQGNEIVGSVTGYTARGFGYAAFSYYFSGISGLKPLIDAGYPIIVLTAGDQASADDPNDENSWGHFRVVIGYDDAASEITMQDPLFGAGYKLSYSVFEDWWQAWSGRWGQFTHPWDVAVTAPASVSQGDTFTVSVTVAYPCPSPFSTASYPASLSQATIQLPAELTLAAAETNPKALGTGTLAAGASETVQWDVVALSAGACSIEVLAQGQASGSVGTHDGNTGYSYTDSIGGTNSISISVQGVAAPSIESSDAAGNKKDTFNPSDTVYAYGSGYGSEEEYDIFVVTDTTWTDGMAFPTRIAGTATTVTSDAAGDMTVTPIWTPSPSLTPGKYDVAVDFDNDGNYDAGIDALDDNEPVLVTAGFLVVPEYWLGTILGLVGCFAALGVFHISKRKYL